MIHEHFLSFDWLRSSATLDYLKTLVVVLILLRINSRHVASLASKKILQLLVWYVFATFIEPAFTFLDTDKEGRMPDALMNILSAVFLRYVCWSFWWPIHYFVLLIFRLLLAARFLVLVCRKTTYSMPLAAKNAAIMFSMLSFSEEVLISEPFLQDDSDFQAMRHIA